jgi:predicted transcriptional regulator
VVVPPTTNDTVVNARIDRDILRQLDEIADEMQRTRSYLIAQAVREFVEREYASLCAVREGESDIDAGRLLTHDAALRWVEELKAGRAPKLPAGRKRRSA